MGAETDSAAEFLDRFAETWAGNDGSALGEFFTEDASLINPFGQRADGRVAIAAMYSEYFAGMLAGTTTTATVDSLRPVGESHAFADAEQTITTPSGDVLLVVHLAALLRREGDDWFFVDSRPFTTAAVPS